VAVDSTAKRASIVRAACAFELTNRLERALRDEVRLLGLEIESRGSSWPRWGPA
jgi:hypothetical protein